VRTHRQARKLTINYLRLVIGRSVALKLKPLATLARFSGGECVSLASDRHKKRATLRLKEKPRDLINPSDFRLDLK